MLQGPGQFKQSLSKLLRTQGECADELLDTLQSERSALEAGDGDRLDALTARKSDLLRRLDELGRSQVNLLAELSFANTPDGMQQALAWCDPDQSLKNLQQSVLDRLARCRELNERNGLTVQYRLGYVRRALDVLNGAPAGSSGVYGPDGRSSSAPQSRLLASG